MRARESAGGGSGEGRAGGGSGKGRAGGGSGNERAAGGSDSDDDGERGGREVRREGEERERGGREVMVRGKGVWERARAYAGGLFPRVGPTGNSSRAHIYTHLLYLACPRAHKTWRAVAYFLLIKYKFKRLAFCSYGPHTNYIILYL